MRTSSIVIATLVILTACGSARSTGGPSSSSSTRIVAPSTQRRPVPTDPSQLVLRAGDYPTGTVDEQGPSDLYDSGPSEAFRKALDAAGLAPSQGAFTRTFHISKTYYGSIQSVAVTLESPRLASNFFRDGARGLLDFNGFAGRTTEGTPMPAPAGLGTEAVAFEGPGLNGGTTLAVVWVRNRAVALLIVDRSQGDPRPELARLSKIMDQRMAEPA